MQTPSGLRGSGNAVERGAGVADICGRSEMPAAAKRMLSKWSSSGVRSSSLASLSSS